MKYGVGIDISKGKSTIAILSIEGEVIKEPFEFNHNQNDLDNLDLLLNQYSKEDLKIIMEETGTYHLPILTYLLDKGYCVIAENAFRIKKYLDRGLRKAKTDKKDSLKLAEYACDNWYKLKKPIIEDVKYKELRFLSRQYFVLDEVCVNIKNRYRNLIYLCFPEYEEIFKGNTVYSTIALEFIEKYPHADIISNTRIDKIQNFLKKHEFRRWKSKAVLIKEMASKSYPSVNMNDELVSNLSQIARLVNEYQKAIDIIKYKITFLSKKSKYFKPINSIYGISEFTTSIIIAELGDILKN